VLLESTDSLLGNFFGELAEDLAYLRGSGPRKRPYQLSLRLIPEDKLPVGNMLELNHQFAHLVRTSSTGGPKDHVHRNLSGQAKSVGASRPKGRNSVS
jgi:hypothetical protein